MVSFFPSLLCVCSSPMLFFWSVLCLLREFPLHVDREKTKKTSVRKTPDRAKNGKEMETWKGRKLKNAMRTKRETSMPISTNNSKENELLIKTISEDKTSFLALSRISICAERDGGERIFKIFKLENGHGLSKLFWNKNVFADNEGRKSRYFYNSYSWPSSTDLKSTNPLGIFSEQFWTCAEKRKWPNYNEKRRDGDFVTKSAVCEIKGQKRDKKRAAQTDLTLTWQRGLFGLAAEKKPHKIQYIHLVHVSTAETNLREGQEKSVTKRCRILSFALCVVYN